VNFPASLYLFSALGGAVSAAISLPFWRALCRRIGHVDDPGHRKIHDTPVPLAGGLAVLTGLLLPLLGIAAAVHWQWLDADALQKLTLVGAIGMTFLGWLDDRRDLRASWKFGGQLLLATLVAGAGVRVTLFVPSDSFSYAVTVLWILTVTNALNFMDNMNGLCAGLGVISATLFGALAALHAQYLVASIAFLAAGAMMGFLPFNFPKATAFLGDAGSHLIGFLLAVLAILPHFHTEKHPHPAAVLSPLLVLAVPLGDLAWVVLLRWRMGKPFYLGDTNHLSHRLMRAGRTRVQAVLFIWVLAAGIGAVAFLLQR
jgi:UDP-GlcNAc:undecaprenyl-phosphate/decaprenyl-phosphate GlcNAc-1-phosphate transferase